MYIYIVALNEEHRSKYLHGLNMNSKWEASSLGGLVMENILNPILRNTSGADYMSMNDITNIFNELGGSRAFIIQPNLQLPLPIYEEHNIGEDLEHLLTTHHKLNNQQGNIVPPLGLALSTHRTNISTKNKGNIKQKQKLTERIHKKYYISCLNLLSASGTVEDMKNFGGELAGGILDKDKYKISYKSYTNYRPNNILLPICFPQYFTHYYNNGVIPRSKGKPGLFTAQVPMLSQFGFTHKIYLNFDKLKTLLLKKKLWLMQILGSEGYFGNLHILLFILYIEKEEMEDLIRSLDDLSEYYHNYKDCLLNPLY